MQPSRALLDSAFRDLRIAASTALSIAFSVTGIDDQNGEFLLPSRFPQSCISTSSARVVWPLWSRDWSERKKRYRIASRRITELFFILSLSRPAHAPLHRCCNPGTARFPPTRRRGSARRSAILRTARTSGRARVRTSSCSIALCWRDFAFCRLDRESFPHE